MASCQWWEEVPCHFIWNLEDDTEKDFISIETSLESKAETARVTGLPTNAPFLLFRAYIHVSRFHGVAKDPDKALLLLDEADRHIDGLVKDVEEREAYMVISKAIRVRILSDHTPQEAAGLESVKEELRQEWLVIGRSERFQMFAKATQGFALARLGRSRYAEAEQVYREALGGCPRNARWFHDFGKVVGRLSREKGASDPQIKEEIDLYRQASALEPRDESIRSSLAFALFRESRELEAKAIFDSVKVMSSHVIQKKAQFLRKQRRNDEVIALVEEGLKHLKRPRAELYMQVVYALEDKERQCGKNQKLRSALRERQMKLIGRAITLEPCHFMAQKRRADLFGKMGRKKESKEAYDEMLKNPRMLGQRQFLEKSYRKYFD